MSFFRRIPFIGALIAALIPSRQQQQGGITSNADPTPTPQPVRQQGGLAPAKAHGGRWHGNTKRTGEKWIAKRRRLSWLARRARRVTRQATC